MHPFPPNSRMRTWLKRSNGKSSKQFQKSLFLYLEERRQLEKALYFKAVGTSKQVCYRCFLRDRVKIVNLLDGSSCLPGKENGYTECKYGGPLGRPGSSCTKARLVRPQEFCFDCTSVLSQFVIIIALCNTCRNL